MIQTKKPRRIELNNNLMRYNKSNIEPVVYPECFEGIIASYADRFPNTQETIEKIHTEWAKYSSYMRVQQ